MQYPSCKLGIHNTYVVGFEIFRHLLCSNLNKIAFVFIKYVYIWLGIYEEETRARAHAGWYTQLKYVLRYSYPQLHKKCGNK